VLFCKFKSILTNEEKEKYFFKMVINQVKLLSLEKVEEGIYKKDGKKS